DQAMRDAKRLASEALQDIRRSVGTLRANGEGFTLVQSLEDLAKNMHSGQLSVDLDIQGREEGFRKQSLLALYRAAQEGMTTVQKHARARQASIQMSLEAEQAVLCMSDDGQGFDPQRLPELRSSGETAYGL